jgi:hypothetical protein
MYQKTIDIWKLTHTQIAQLKAGQWVNAGGNLGRFWGVKPSGTVVVAWYHNAKNSGDFNQYNRILFNYAKG